jgi:hypothetical protein
MQSASKTRSSWPLSKGASAAGSGLEGEHFLSKDLPLLRLDYFLPKNGLQISAPRPRQLYFSRFQLFISVRAFAYRQQTDLACAAAERWLAGVMAERALSKSARSTAMVPGSISSFSLLS